MNADDIIPAFGLYGELQQFPDAVHCEAFSARAPLHEWHIMAHRHPQMSQLFTIRSGSVCAKVDDDAWQLSGEDFLYVPEMCVHGFDFEPGTEGSVHSFPSSVVASLGRSSPELSAILANPFSGSVTTSLGQVCSMLAEVEESQSTFRPQVVVSLTHLILSMLAETQSRVESVASPGAADRLVVLDRLITEHFADGWSASDYARALSVSTGHLSRICRRASGLGAAAYVERKIMSEACRLLAFTQLPISEIGYRLGYNDPSYFSKRFTNAQGQAPSAYRARFTS